MTSRSRRAHPFLLLLTALALVLSACGGGGGDADEDASPTDAAETGAAFPVTVDTPEGEVTIEEQPERIVSLSPSSTEILFAIGAGDQVEAVDEYSTYPEDAPITDLSGYEPNVEAVLGYNPDLVVISADTNDLVASLDEAGVPVIVDPAPATIADGYTGMSVLGKATGHAEETEELITSMREDIDAAFAEADLTKPVRVYHELDDQYYSASSNSFIGSIYEEFGAINIADDADQDGSGYPQLTEEAIIEADPQLIVISDQAGYTAEDVASRSGWQDIAAVANGDIIAVDADVSSRWGPRLPTLVEDLAQALSSVHGPAGG